MIVGPRWTDISDYGCAWADLLVDSFNNVIGFSPPTGSYGPTQTFEFIDVWPAVTARLGQ